MPLNPDDPIFLRIPLKCRETVIAALRDAGFSSEATEVDRFTSMYASPEENAAREAAIEDALRAVRYNDDISVDPDAAISEADGGTHVMVWYWIPDPDADGDEDEEEEFDPEGEPGARRFEEDDIADDFDGPDGEAGGGNRY